MKNLNDKECYALKVREVVKVMGICERKLRDMIAATVELVLENTWQNTIPIRKQVCNDF